MDGLVFVLVVGLLASPVVLIWAAAQVQNLRRRVSVLEKKVADLSAAQQSANAAPIAPEAPPVWTPQPDVSPSAELETSPSPAFDDTAAARPAADAPSVPPSSKSKPKARSARTLSSWDGIEKQLGSSWMVWVGGLALILGGVFLVNYSIENGLLGPWGRIIAGLLFGGLALGAGEWLRRQPSDHKYSAGWAHMPMAVTAAGLITLFGTVYAGYALYGLFPPLLAFIALAFVAMATVLISVLHGPLLALVGVAGAYGVPLLVASDNPSVPMLVSYLFLFCTASLALFRYKGWGQLAWANMVGVVFWSLMVVNLFAMTGTDLWALCLFLLASFGLFTLYGWSAGDFPEDLDLKQYFAFWKTNQPRRVVATMAVLTAGLLGIVTLSSSHAPVALSFVAVFGLALLGIAKWRSDLAEFAFLAVGTVIAILLSWDFTSTDLMRTPRFMGGDIPYGFDPHFIIPQGYEMFQGIAGFTALIVLAFGYWQSCRTTRVGLWASFTTAGPLALFAVSYWKINGLQTLPIWSVIALTLGAFFCLFAYALRDKSAWDKKSHGLAAYAIGGFTALALALALGAGLQGHWLGIAIAVLVPCVAGVYLKIPLVAIRWVTVPFVAFVLGQLLREGHILAFVLEGYVPVDWYLYGYGLPALALGYGAYQFGKDKRDLLVDLLEGATFSSWMAMWVMLAHDLVPDSVTMGSAYSFVEQSLQSVVWLGNALGLYWLQQRAPARLRDYAWKGLLAAAAVQVVGLQVLGNNPALMSFDPVGAWPVLNWLIVGYAVPCLFAVAFAHHWRAQGLKRPSMIAYGLAIGLGFVFLNMEIRQFYLGNVLNGPKVSAAELYTYSAVWLILAVGLMAIVVGRTRPLLQKAALALLLLTVFKVFLIDLSALEGLLRAVSFIGLGACLIGIGFVYQKYVLKLEKPASAMK